MDVLNILNLLYQGFQFLVKTCGSVTTKNCLNKSVVNRRLKSAAMAYSLLILLYYYYYYYYSLLISLAC